MSNIPISIESTNSEIWARIAKAEARKYDCSVNIDFSNGNRTVQFIGDQAYVPHILAEVRNIFNGYSR